MFYAHQAYKARKDSQERLVLLAVLVTPEPLVASDSKERLDSPARVDRRDSAAAKVHKVTLDRVDLPDCRDRLDREDHLVLPDFRAKLGFRDHQVWKSDAVICWR